MDNLQIIKAYKKAFEIRFIEDLIAENYKEGLMRCPMHLSIGQELVPSILALFHDKNDFAVGTHRSHGHYLGKGGDIDSFLDELYGLNSGCSGGRGGSMHLIDNKVGFMGSTAIVGNTIPVGVGLAESQKLLSKDNLTYIFLGDAATEEGVFFESLNYACIRALPCFFVIENNSYSVYTSFDQRQSKNLIAKKCSAFDTLYLFNDKHDFLDLYNKWLLAREFIKKESKPVVLEVMTHRIREHCGPNLDDDLEYRPIQFLKKWEENDIIKKFRNYITFKNYESEETLLEIEQNIKNNLQTKFYESQERRIEFNNILEK